MTPFSYRYQFTRRVPFDEVQQLLALAVLAVEGLHGAAGVRLDTAYRTDPEANVCVIEADTKAGRDLNRIFAGLLVRGFGDDAFVILRSAESCHCVEEVMACLS